MAHLSVVSNVEYHFLPEEHHITANVILKSSQNISLTRNASKILSPVVLSVCSQSSNIIDSYNVMIENVMFKQCPQAHLINLLINVCYSCTLENYSSSYFQHLQ